MNPKESKEMTKRLQFDFTKEALDDLDELKLITKSTTRAEVLRKALRFYEYVTRMANDGYKVELTKGKEKQTLTPLLVL